MKRLILATRNAHKVEELQELLPEFEVVALDVVPDAPEVEETGVTFEENAALKAVAISEMTTDWVLADDSGLEVDALGGEPGVYSARYAGTHGDDAGNNAKLVRELEDEEERSARFRCVLALAEKGEVLGTFAGAVEGRIQKEATGEGGFGYDPLFVPEGHEQSFAELGAEVKNGMSHRRRAVDELLGWLKRRS